MMQLSDDVIKTRKPVWVALSDLWLDTEIDETWIRQIADVIVQSGLSESEIADVFTYELAPFLYPNLYSVAGVWNGFDVDWVCQQASERLGKKNFSVKVVAKVGLTTRGIRGLFEQVKSLAYQ